MPISKLRKFCKIFFFKISQMIWDLGLAQKKGNKIKKVTRVISKKKLQIKGLKKEQKS